MFNYTAILQNNNHAAHGADKVNIVRRQHQNFGLVRDTPHFVPRLIDELEVSGAQPLVQD